MAALGWLLNMGLAGSGVEGGPEVAVVAPDTPALIPAKRLTPEPTSR